MKVAKYRKKPVTIEAIQWTGNNQLEIHNFTEGDAVFKTEWETQFITSTVLYINTLEGKMKAPIGWWIIKGVQGEFYPCNPDIFEETYEKV